MKLDNEIFQIFKFKIIDCKNFSLQDATEEMRNAGDVTGQMVRSIKKRIPSNLGQEKSLAFIGYTVNFT